MPDTTTAPDSLTRWLDREATLRIMAIEATTLSRGLCLLHDLEGEAASDFAQALVGGLLWASDLKAGQTLSLQIELGTRTLHVDATPVGLVRGMVTQRTHESPIARVTIRRFGSAGILYQSVVDTPARTVAEALEGHARQSDQQNAMADLRCELDSQGLPRRAYGALLRDFPSTPAGGLANLVSAWRARGTWSASSPCAHLDERTWDRLSHQEIHHHCPCSRERALNSIRALGEPALKQAAEAGETMEVVCDFCRSTYTFEAVEFLPGASGTIEA